MQHPEQRSNLPADLPILQWLGRSENKEVIIASLRYEVIPAHSVFQSKGEPVKRCMFIVEGKVLQCDQFSKKTSNEDEAEADSPKQQEQKSEDCLVDDKDNYLIRPLDRSSCIVLCAWELCENKPSQFMLRTGEVPCKIGFFNSQVFTTLLLPRLKNTLSNKAILLEKFILFRDISYASRLRMAEIFTFSLHPQGEFIFQENQSCTERIVFFLQQGDYSVCKKLRKFQETPSHLQQQQKQLPSTLQKIICLSEGEMIGLVSGNSFQFSLKSETECKVGRVSFEALKWMLRLWAIGSDEDLAKQLKQTMNRILQKAESVQQQFYLQNQFRFENRQASEAKLARESFVSQVKDLFMSKVQQNSQKLIEEEQPQEQELPNQNYENSSTLSPKNSSSLTSPKRSYQSTNLIRQNDSLIFLQKISSNQYGGVNSPCSKEPPNIQPFSVKDMAIGHLNLFDQTPSHSGQNKQQSSSSSLSQSLQQQQQERRSFSLQHRSSISSYASNTPSSLATPKTILYDPRKASVFSSALPQINRISGDMTDTNKDITTSNKSVLNKSTRFHSFSTAFNNSNSNYLSNGYSTGSHMNISNNNSGNLLQNTTTAAVAVASPATTKSSYFSQIQHVPKQQTQPFQPSSIPNLNISKSYSSLHPSSPTKEHNRSSRELSLNSINQQLIPDQSSSVNELSKHETRTSFSSSAAVLSDLKNRRITAQGKANIFPANDIIKPNNRYSFLSTSSPSKQKDILKSNNTLNTTNLENKNTNYSSISVFLNNTQLSTAHPLNHFKMKVEMEQLVKEKEMILTNLQERQKKNNSMRKNFIQPSGFQQELGRKPSSSAHVLQTSPHHKNLVKKAVQDLEDSAYFSLDFATDTHYRRGFLAKLSAKIANY